MASKESMFKIIGASNHTDKERQKDDYYATDPKAIDILINECKVELQKDILEPACGEGHLAERLKDYGYNVVSSDKIDRNYGDTKDFFDITEWHGDIITNPPYKYAKEFVEHALSIVDDGAKVIMFLKLTFLEGKARKSMYAKYPLKTLYVMSSRLICAMNGDFDKYPSSAVAYGWFVWEKGYKGESMIKHVN